MEEEVLSEEAFIDSLKENLHVIGKTVKDWKMKKNS